MRNGNITIQDENLAMGNCEGTVVFKSSTSQVKTRSNKTY